MSGSYGLTRLLQMRPDEPSRMNRSSKRLSWSSSPSFLTGHRLSLTMILLSCGHFMAAIMGDYVAGFLGSSEGYNWNMNAFDVSGNSQ